MYIWRTADIFLLRHTTFNDAFCLGVPCSVTQSTACVGDGRVAPLLTEWPARHESEVNKAGAGRWEWGQLWWVTTHSLTCTLADHWDWGRLDLTSQGEIGTLARILLTPLQSWETLPYSSIFSVLWGYGEMSGKAVWPGRRCGGRYKDKQLSPPPHCNYPPHLPGPAWSATGAAHSVSDRFFKFS